MTTGTTDEYIEQLKTERDQWRELVMYSAIEELVKATWGRPNREWWFWCWRDMLTAAGFEQ